MQGKALCLRREKRPTHLMCGVLVKQQRICGGKRNKLVFLFFFFVCFVDQNLAEKG
jgi:hypothetical protein